VIVSLIFGVAILLFDIRDVMPDIMRTQFPDDSKSATVELVEIRGDLSKQITDIGFKDVILYPKDSIVPQGEQSTEYVGTAVIDNIFDYPEYVAELHKLGVYCYGINYGEIVRVNAEIKRIMIIISSILAIIGFLIIIVYIMQSISRYTKNFGVRLALGMRYGTIVKEFILIIEFLLLAGVVFSKIISMILYYAVQKKVDSVLSIDISVPSTFSQGALVMFVAVNIMLIFSILLIRKKIQKINVTTLALE
jgi:ABC-type antimicrobial peptide transport system permease subunit